MNIYEGDEIDLAAATRELRGSGAITNDGVRKSAVAEISTAALLDIAASLRIIAAEATLAMSGEPAPGDDREADDEIDNPEESIGIGDFVIGEGWGTPGRVVGMGESEGAPFVDVVDDEEDETYTRVWLDSVHLAPTEADELEAAPLAEAIDDDFETETVSALDLLRAAESKGKKKGTKK